jgi:hypothetical protein
MTAVHIHKEQLPWQTGGRTRHRGLSCDYLSLSSEREAFPTQAIVLRPAGYPCSQINSQEAIDVGACANRIEALRLRWNRAFSRFQCAGGGQRYILRCVAASLEEWLERWLARRSSICSWLARQTLSLLVSVQN